VQNPTTKNNLLNQQLKNLTVMNPSIINTQTGTKKEILNSLTAFLSAPLGTMFSLSFAGQKENHVGVVEENTFEIYNEAKTATVCGDTLINLFLGKTNLSTLKFQ
jgi:hypothetical protein